MAALARAPFDVLITDLVLPEIDGLALLNIVRSSHPDVPVVIITGIDKVEAALRAVKTGAVDYLVKPVMPEILAHSVARALMQRGLIRENAALRRTVAVLDAGQRISSRLDRDAVLATSAQAFLDLCLASSVLVFTCENDQLTLVHSAGLAKEEEGSLPLAIVPPIQAVFKDAPLDPRALRTSGTRYEEVYYLPAIAPPENHGTSHQTGAVALLYTSPPDTQTLEIAHFLASHLALAFNNLRQVEDVEDLAYVDDLTNLANRRYLKRALEKEIELAPKTGEVLALLFLDLDHFKKVNDAYGHTIGSKLLVEVGDTILDCVRESDVVARWGGDEYVTLLRATSRAEALIVAERIRSSISERRYLASAGLAISISACIGVSCYPEHAQEAERLIDLADQAMYAGKRGDRNAIHVSGAQPQR